jgi:hypothetical protein
MRPIVNCLFVLLLLLSQKTEAATIPLSVTYGQATLDTGLKNPQLLTPSSYVPYKKAGFIKKLQYKILQKRLKYLSNKYGEGTPSKTNVLSIISLIAGLLMLISILANAGILALIAGFTALITGIIALGKKYNNSKSSRAMAIIGVVLGGGFFILLLVLLIALSSWDW